ncbi:MAG: ABC transporter ATP-binding protein/permease [Alphaproteobacteria bacterium]
MKKHAPSEPAKPGAARAALGMLWPYLWPKDRPAFKARLVLAAICLVLAKVANVYAPLLYKDAVDLLGKPENLAAALLIGVILAYGLARIGATLFAELREALFAALVQGAVRGVGLRVFRHLHQLSLRFHLERRTGGLSRVIERGVKAIDTLLGFAVFSILPTLFEIVVVLAILWSVLDWRFAAVTLATIVSYVLFTKQVTTWRLGIRRRMNDEDTRAHSKAVDSLLNYETVKYFNAEVHEARRFDRALAAYEKAAIKSRLSLSALNVGQAVIISIGLIAVMAMAGLGVAAGTMTIGEFVMVNAYLLQLYQPLNMFGFVYRELMQSLTDIENMFSLLDVKAEIADRPGAPTLAVSKGEIAFEDVAFGYDPRRPILKGVSFSVPAGKTVAIVGPSGAGKSTIGRLLYRFYDVDEGRITIDGQDLREVTQDSVRAAIGIVPQDTVLFNDDLLYNILYGRPDASEDEAKEAARLAQIADFVESLPDGWSTQVGERGLKLSGGEKQRVAIARTILKNPPILLLDEATSALDTATEQAIQKNLEALAEGRTAIVIAHRLSTVVNADEILVFHEGRIAERGRHRALLAAGGIYAEMWARQLEDRDADERPADEAGDGAGPARETFAAG